jgi:hypothetical protein
MSYIGKCLPALHARHAVCEESEGEANIIRYADDFVCFFQYESEAKRFYKELK